MKPQMEVQSGPLVKEGGEMTPVAPAVYVYL